MLRNRGPIIISIVFLLAFFCLLTSGVTVAEASVTVTLAWDTNQEPDVIGYKVHYGTLSKNYQYTVDINNNTSCTIGGLEEGKTYFFAVTAYNSLFESDYSMELAVDFDGDATVDFDGDATADVAIYRPSSGAWFILPSSTGSYYAVGFGGNPNDVPVPGDYDGDGKTDIAIYRSGTWFILPSSGGSYYTVGFGGNPNDVPVPGDYDGDGKTDCAVYRSGSWYIMPSSGGSPYDVGWGGDPSPFKGVFLLFSTRN